MRHLLIKIIIIITGGIGMVFIINNSYAAQVSCSFSRSLYLGARGEDVACLQRYLSTESYYNYSGGATGYFGPITKNAVSKWQAARGVFPARGFFGPLSRAKYKELVVTISIPQQTTSEKISLPDVNNSEILIDSSGVSSTESYIEYFVANSSQISFDVKKFESALKDENGVFLFIPDLAEKAIQGGANQETKSSLLINKEFIEAKFVFLKSIKVFGEAVILHQKMIGFDKLTLELAQKILDFENGKISKTDLSNFYEQYKKLADSERKELLKKVGLVAEKPSLLKRIIVMFGLEDEFFAYAASGMPFGGKIGPPFFCLCSASFLISVGPPKPPFSGFLMVPLSFLSSPLFYSQKSIRTGAWWLGLYSPAAIPCLQLLCCPCPTGCCPCCLPVGIGNLIFMTGTSI